MILWVVKIMNFKSFFGKKVSEENAGDENEIEDCSYDRAGSRFLLKRLATIKKCCEEKSNSESCADDFLGIYRRLVRCTEQSIVCLKKGF